MKILIAGLAGVMALAAAGEAADLAEIKERGTLRVAVASLSPFAISDAAGALTGFEIDSTTALAAHLGVAVEYVERPFCKLADAVIEGEADMIASGYSNTPARRLVLDFSLPYHDTEYYLVIARDKVKKAKTLRGLNRKDVSIGYQKGGVSGDVATGEFSGAALQGFSSFAKIIDALRAGDIDGAVMFSPYQDLVKKEKRRKFIVPHEFALMRTIEAFAVDPESEDLREALNEWVIARDLDGYWDDLEKKWFNPENAVIGALPPYRCPGKIPTG